MADSHLNLDRGQFLTLATMAAGATGVGAAALPSPQSFRPSVPPYAIETGSQLIVGADGTDA